MTDIDLRAETRTAEPGWRVAISAEFQRIEDTCSRAARGQSETARVWRVVNLWLGAGAVVASGVAGSLVLATRSLGPLAGGLALVAALLTTIISMVGPARREGQATEAAKAYQAVQTLTRQARQVDLPGQSFDQARRALADLTDRWHGVDRAAIPVPALVRRRTDREARGHMGSMVRVFRVSPSL
jgi:hypothetical protein